ncbi:hypothetical protein F2Q69_00006191 [Brassica cretica]|uniref:Uncharacterized protein n=1 Tax=Brassica cretica TaxID=69181 RepID=A0A8S9NZT3_BRACR|nr:hypothetical protein F2Q69_00006191 [Brassica cretica]
MDPNQTLPNIESQATIELQYQIGPRSLIEPERESGIVPEKGSLLTTQPELRGMVSTLIDKSRNQEIAYRTIANRLDQTERELAEHQASARKRNQLLSGPLRKMQNSQNPGAFSTPELPSARSGRYMGESSQRTSQHGVAYRSLSYNRLDEIDTRMQGPQIALI